MTDRQILIITLEPVAGKMAGPAIRALELARRLAPENAVTVYSPHDISAPLTRPEDEKNLSIVCGGGKNKLYLLSEKADILFIQANVLKQFPGLTRAGKYLAVDLYDPYLFSLLEQYDEDPVTASSSYRLMHQVLEKHMLSADFCVCASERQRDYWLGRFCALGRISPEVYKFDRSLRKLIDVVPFGTQEQPAERTGPGGIKGKVKGIGVDDKVLLWGGGIWDWFDPLTIVRAVAAVKEKMPTLRLFFMGSKSPNPQVAEMSMVARTRALAKELNLLDKHVFLQEDWTPYEERADYLLDADIAVSAHFDLVETRFSFRTRILDYFWAGLPILTTEGDDLATLIQTQGAGYALPFQDVQAWSNAIIKLLSDADLQASCRRASLDLAQRFQWSRAVEPLKHFCRQPYHLPPHTRVTMPSLIERAQAVYSRGGKDLVWRRSKELLGDLLR
ncbi:MAG TPA: glycosyltransferase family 4 protein [Planktothrix sp.]